MSAPLTVDEVIAQLGLKPHPEGGYYRETFRDSGGHKGALVPPPSSIC